MNRLATTLLISAALGLSGCASWPVPGTGGMAEHRLESADPAHRGLGLELELMQRHLDLLVLEGAELCFPATVVQARQRQDRIARQLQGDLGVDAANDLIVQRRLLARLERQLDYVKAEDVCVLPTHAGQQRPGDMGKRILELLNSDNQFAHDSPELNPKYIGRLAEAARLLRDQPGYQLRITGHADATGDQAHNQQLSLARSRMVSRYLQIFGLNAKRIQVDAVGSEMPLFDGSAPQVRLTNRRVSIELVEADRLAAAPED